MANQGDNTAAWDSDDEPQQSEGSFALADLLAGFSGTRNRANGSSLIPNRPDNAQRSDVEVAALSPADYLLGDLGAPPPVCTSTHVHERQAHHEMSALGSRVALARVDVATAQDEASRSETALTTGSSEQRDRDSGLRSGAEVRATLS